MKHFFSNYFSELYLNFKRVSTLDLENISELIKKTHENRKKIIIVGNGGSAAMASHVTVDLTKAAGIRAVNFNEADLLTCFANDYGYENWISRALEFYADYGDMVILISSSGKSKNMLEAAKMCKRKKIYFCTLTGFSDSNPLKKLGNINLWVNSRAYNIIENVHQIWLLSIVDKIIGKTEYSS